MSIYQSISRRRAIKIGLTGLLSMSATTASEAISLNEEREAFDNKSKRKFNVVGQDSLKKRAAAKGLIYGAATERGKFVSNPEFADLFVKNCAMLVPENELKWDALRPTPHIFDYTKADWLAKFARTHKMLFRGTPLVWNLALPKWFKEVVNRQNAEKFLVEHITAVTKHYAGEMHSWDVVNEAIEPAFGRSDGLYYSPWLDFLGPDYIELAFRVAANADPRAMLVYNDAHLEYDTPKHEAKRKALLKYLERWKSKGVPIHAFGIQSHLRGHQNGLFNAKKFRKFLADVASLGLKIMITELDVKDSLLPVNIKVRDRIVASAFEDYLSLVLDEKAVIAVITWGLSDRYTWFSTYAPRSDGKPVRPLPFDSNLKPKLAWNAFARAFDKAPKR